jgi:hypothetical protein
VVPLGRRASVVELACHQNLDGGRTGEFEANGHRLQAGAGCSVMVVVFQSCEFNWIRRRNSFPEHLRYDEDNESPEKASAPEEIYQRVANGGEHGLDDQCNHK